MIYQINVRVDLYDIELAIEKGLKIVWPNENDKIKKGDTVYIVKIVDGDRDDQETALVAKAKVAGNTYLGSAEELPGYEEGDIWNKEYVEERYKKLEKSSKPSNFVFFESVTPATSDYVINDGSFEESEVKGAQQGMIELATKKVEEYEKHFASVEEIAEIFRRFYENTIV